MQLRVSTLLVVVFLNVVFGITLVNAQGVDPRTLPGLTLWLRADSGVVTGMGGDSVTQWQDLSGNGYSTTGPARHDSLPTLIAHVPALNNMPAINFNGSTNMFYGSLMAGVDTSSLTFFIVAEGGTAQSTGTNYCSGLFRIGPRATGLWLYRRFGGPTGDFVTLNNFGTTNTDVLSAGAGTMPDAGFPFAIWGMRKTHHVDAAIYKNGVLGNDVTDTAISGQFTNAPYLIANTNLISGFDNHHGQIAEIIIYEGALTDTQMAQINNYLYNKYAPPVSLGPDIIQPYKLCADTLNAGNRFSSYLWSTGATTSQIIVKHSGTYSVSVTDVFGRSSADTINVTIPIVALTTPPAESVCYGQTVSIATQLVSPAQYSYLWSNTATTASINAGVSGRYYAKVTDSTGCFQGSDTTVIGVDSLSHYLSLGPDTSFCRNSLLGLSSPRTGLGLLHFSWSTSSNDSVITVASSGTYSVTVTDTASCVASASVTVTVTTSSAPNVDFKGDTLCFGQVYEPINLSSPVDSIASYAWNFGDGNTSTLPNPKDTYALPGTYTVNLKVVSNNGCSKSVNKPAIVDALPIASFGGGTGCVNNSFQFTDLSSVTPGNIIVMWSWNLGDSTISDTSNPYHVYSLPGTYPVYLTVTDNYGCSGTTHHSIAVANSQFHAPAQITPANGASLEHTTVFFAWNSVPQAVSYTLEISPTLDFSSPMIYNVTGTQDSVSGLQSFQTYYWEVIARDECNDSALSIIDTFSIFSPADLSCLMLWLRADSGVVATSGNVNQWKDWSGNMYNASSTTGQPTLISEPLLNNMPSLKFNGVNQAMQGNPIPNIESSSLTMFFITRGDSIYNDGLNSGWFTIGQTASGMCAYRHHNNQEFAFVNNLTVAGNYLQSGDNSLPDKGYPYGIFEVKKTFNTESTMYVNGDEVDDNTNAVLSGGFTNTNYVVGELFDYFKGAIAEEIIFNCALDDGTRGQVESYLYNKYAPPVYLGSDIVQKYKLCPVTLTTGNRFVSYLWSTGETAGQISVNQSGTYSVAVTDVFGRVSQDTINVTLPYQGSSPASDTTICLGASASISQIISNPNAYHYHWSNGANTTTITVNATGFYYCTITDTSGCSIKTDTVHVIVDTISLATLITPDTLICSGSGIVVRDSGRNIISYLWSPGADTSRNFAMDSSGAYTLNVTDIYGCTAQNTVNVTTHAHAPVVDFQSSNLCLGGISNFTNLSQAVSPDAFDSIIWNFGGGSPDSSFLTNPATLYPAFGNYTVTLQAFTDSGCSASKTRTITVYPNPSAAFTYKGSSSANENGGIICAQTYVVLQDTSIAVGGDSLISRQWKFNGDIDTTISPVVLYLFNQEGEYDATLIVTNANNCVDSVTQVVDVFAPLKADFNYQNVCLGDTTVFTDLTQSLSIVSWNWQFGDIYTSGIQNPEHYYEFATNYSATLTVQNAIGCLSSITKTIKIVQSPVADFVDTAACIYQNYNPTDSSTAYNSPIANWTWDIAGRILHGQMPQYYLVDTGKFNVKLTVSTAEGCADSISKTVTSYPVPTAAFTYTPSYGSAPVEVSFTNKSKNAVTYFWTFGDGDSSVEVNSQHTYTQDSLYNVVLYATNAYGCTDAVTKVYQAIPTTLDIAVDAVYANQTTQADGSVYVQVIVQMSNLGSRFINSADLKATLGDGEIMVQHWTGLLMPGQTIVDTMPDQMDVPAALANTYLCVTAQNVNDGQQEVTTDNNTVCISLTGQLQLAGPSPNPAGSQATLGLIMPKQGTVDITIYNELGQNIVKDATLKLPVGRTDYQIPVQQMEGGQYYIRVLYNGQTQTRTFVVR